MRGDSIRLYSQFHRDQPIVAFSTQFFTQLVLSGAVRVSLFSLPILISLLVPIILRGIEQIFDFKQIWRLSFHYVFCSKDEKLKFGRCN